MRRELPSADGVAVSPAARDVAETLLDAFYQQDLREERLLRCDAAGAEEAADRSADAMAKVFRVEFPGRPRVRAERAGVTFARALFLQDEIENWPALCARRAEFPAQRLDELLYSDLSEPYANDARDDPRWADVRDLLSRVCADAGIDEAYGERQTEFWRRHGQRDDDWMRAALDAHRLKIEAMVAGCDTDDAAALSEYFLSGVELHDGWGRTDRERDFAEIRDVVAAYYQRVFELRGKAPVA